MNLDLFPKQKEEIKIKTSFGALVSIITYVILCFLLINELVSYLKNDVTSEVSIDVSHNSSLEIHFDILFPSLGCEDFGIDTLALDTGEQQLEVQKDIKKDHIKGINNKFGCHLTGFVKATKVKGEFHIAFGRHAQATTEENHMHRFTMQELWTFNCSHKINKFWFGEDFPGSSHALDGTSKIVEKGLGRFQYFIQIVPTIYRDTRRSIYTNQYSVTEDSVIVEPVGTFKQPGIISEEISFEKNPRKG